MNAPSGLGKARTPGNSLGRPSGIGVVVNRANAGIIVGGMLVVVVW